MMKKKGLNQVKLSKFLLSELIEALGRKVSDFNLERRFDGKPYWRARIWLNTEKDGYQEISTEGNPLSGIELPRTPEEAISNLWLKIHEKQKTN